MASSGLAGIDLEVPEYFPLRELCADPELAVYASEHPDVKSIAGAVMPEDTKSSVCLRGVWVAIAAEALLAIGAWSLWHFLRA
jgi:hypothetical protein